MYTAFAAVYDRLMGEVDYPAWAALYEKLLTEAGVPCGAAVTECACGTGSLTLPLSARYRMTGVDLSEDMLSVAARRAREQGKFIPFVAQDMRALALHRQQDAVLCTCDGVNYLLTEDDLLAFFTRARAALKAGGALIFDLSTPYKLREVLGNNTLFESREDWAYIWQNAWDGEKNTAELALDIFVKSGEKYDRLCETQTQRAWTAEELAGALKRAGFRLIKTVGARGEALRPDDERWHLVAKPEETAETV